MWKAALRPSFVSDTHGAISIVGALVLPVLLGMSGLALEYGGAMLAKVETQRVADLTAMAGADAYARYQRLSDATMAAESVAVLNGIPRDRITITLEPSPAAPGTMAVQSEITTQRTLSLARVLNARQYLDVTVVALAGRIEGAPACIQALDPSGSGVTLGGGTSITANDCGVASNATVTTPCGTSMTTSAVTYNSAAPPTQCNNILSPGGGPAPLVRGTTPDPLAGSSAVALAATNLAVVAGLTVPVVAAGGDIDFGNKEAATQQQAAAVGCAADYNRSQKLWTFTCPGQTTVNLGNITLASNMSLDFGYGAPATTAYNISGTVENAGNNMRFAPGIYTIAEGISVDSGATTEFDGGSFRVGPASSGNAIKVNSNATLTLGDPLVIGEIFQIFGDVDTSANSCLTFGAAENHELAGAVEASGGIIFGAGVYTIDGYLHLGPGAAVHCAGADISFQAIDTAIILSGQGADSAGPQCRNQAFCSTSGYQSMRITASTTGPFAKVAIIGPLDTAVTYGASMHSGGFEGEISGAFYFPNGPISLSGGANVSGGADACLQLIGSTVTLSGGATAASDCVDAVAGSGGTTRLLR
ncbi:MAG: Flp pilus assembly protein TadG [Paracoccaceae bacterium]|jgi:Flp pilus assembly protein TadG